MPLILRNNGSQVPFWSHKKLKPCFIIIHIFLDIHLIAYSGMALKTLTANSSSVVRMMNRSCSFWFSFEGRLLCPIKTLSLNLFHVSMELNIALLSTGMQVTPKMIIQRLMHYSSVVYLGHTCRTHISALLLACLCLLGKLERYATATRQNTQPSVAQIEKKIKWQQKLSNREIDT